MQKNLPAITASLLLVATASFAQAPAASSAPSDAQIAATVIAANNDDINAGKLASTKSKSADVQNFAKEMIADHTEVNKKAAALVNKLKITPEENADSKAMKDEGAAALKKLKDLSGPEFDKSYVDNEVTLHQKVLDSLDNTLIPNAKNPDLKNLLTAVRPTINAHLQHAKKMQTALK